MKKRKLRENAGEFEFKGGAGYQEFKAAIARLEKITNDGLRKKITMNGERFFGQGVEDYVDNAAFMIELGLASHIMMEYRGIKCPEPKHFQVNGGTLTLDTDYNNHNDGHVRFTLHNVEDVYRDCMGFIESHINQQGTGVSITRHHRPSFWLTAFVFETKTHVLRMLPHNRNQLTSSKKKFGRRAKPIGLKELSAHDASDFTGVTAQINQMGDAMSSAIEALVSWSLETILVIFDLIKDQHKSDMEKTRKKNDKVLEHRRLAPSEHMNRIRGRLNEALMIQEKFMAAGTIAGLVAGIAAPLLLPVFIGLGMGLGWHEDRIDKKALESQINEKLAPLREGLKNFLVKYDLPDAWTFSEPRIVFNKVHYYAWFAEELGRKDTLHVKVIMGYKSNWISRTGQALVDIKYVIDVGEINYPDRFESGPELDLASALGKIDRYFKENLINLSRLRQVRAK